MIRVLRITILLLLLATHFACSMNGSEVSIDEYIFAEESEADVEDNGYVPPEKYLADDGKPKKGELLKRYKENEQLVAEYERLRKQERESYKEQDESATESEKTEKGQEAVTTEPEPEKAQSVEEAQNENWDEDMALLAELYELESMEDDEYVPELAQGDPVIADPIKYWNVGMFHFNDKLYFWVMKPVSQGYAYVAPEPFRKSVDKVFQNLEFPKRFVNCSLQGRFKPAGQEVGAFLLNSTVGLLGIWNPANKWFGWIPENRDFDQSLGKARMPQLMYIVWPLFGPSSVRGTFGVVADSALDGATYISGAGTLDMINQMSLGEFQAYETLRNSSLNPYVAVRNAYVQNRIKKVSE